MGHGCVQTRAAPAHPHAPAAFSVLSLCSVPPRRASTRGAPTARHSPEAAPGWFPSDAHAPCSQGQGWGRGREPGQAVEAHGRSHPGASPRPSKAPWQLAWPLVCGRDVAGARASEQYTAPCSHRAFPAGFKQVLHFTDLQLQSQVPRGSHLLTQKIISLEGSRRGPCLPGS